MKSLSSLLQVFLYVSLPLSAWALVPPSTKPNKVVASSSRSTKEGGLLAATTTSPPSIMADEDAFSMMRVGLNPILPVKSVEHWSKPREFTAFQQFARVAPVLTMAAYAVNPAPFDAGVQSVWDVILSWDCAHTGLFEAHVATFSFLFFIIAFSLVHVVLGEDEARKWRLDRDAPQVDPLEWIVHEAHLWLTPLASYLASIWVYQQVFHTYRPPPILAPTFGVLVVEVMVGVFLYDLLFAPVHIFMHKAPWKEFRGIHGWHHRHTQGALNPIETVQNSYWDAGMQVMFNIFVQHITPFGGPKHTLSRLIHNIIVTYMLTESHSGYNFRWQTHNIWPEFLGGSPRHERHHKDGRVYYQQFFTYMDDALGFTDQDVQAEMVAKQQQRKAEEELN